MVIYRFIFLSIILLAASQFAAGQQTMTGKRQILVNGVVIDAATENTLANVQFSVSGRSGGMTNRSGLFSLSAIQFDTVEFRMVGYKSAMLIIGSSYTAHEYLVLIPMVTDTLQIGEVIVMPKLPNLRDMATGSTLLDSKEYENARSNINMSVHQGLTGVTEMGDPSVNYDMIRRKQTIDAFEKGGIPSSQMLSVSPFMIIPAIYLLINGLPEQPPALAPRMTNKELDQLIKAYRDLIFKEKK